MKTVYLALLVGILTIILPTFAGVSWGWTVLPGLAAGMITFVMINRKYGKIVEGILQDANRDLQTAQDMMQRAQNNSNARAMKVAQKSMEKKSNQAIEKLKQGLAYTDWQVGSHSSLNAQIGMVIFSHNIFQALQGQKNKLASAIPYLEESMVKGWRANLLQGLWHAWIRLAVCYYRASKDFDKIDQVMNQIVSVAKKEGFTWSVYSWFCVQNKDLDRAIEILVRGSKESSDPHLKANLEALQNGKSLKMGEYGNQWWGLGLELPKHMSARQSMGHPRMRSNRRSRR
jgi:hypothetical protein